MADIGEEELRKEINAILKDADLSVMSAKKVRQQLEDKLKCNLNSRKQEIDDMVMSFVNSKEDEEDEDDDASEDEEEENKKKPVKRAAPAKKTKQKKWKGDSSEDGEGSESDASADDDDDYEAKKPAPKKKGAPAKKKKGSESDSDSDWGKGGGGGGKKKAAGGGGGGGGRGKGGGYTKAKKLSPALANLMGKDSMPRHEVVKKMWSMIKERNLYDPNNKQFAICDDDLIKVIGTKRFRTFGMMKYLKSHFHD